MGMHTYTNIKSYIFTGENVNFIFYIFTSENVTYALYVIDNLLYFIDFHIIKYKMNLFLFFCFFFSIMSLESPNHL